MIFVYFVSNVQTFSYFGLWTMLNEAIPGLPLWNQWRRSCCLGGRMGTRSCARLHGRKTPSSSTPGSQMTPCW